ncbi:MAG: IS1380 family transposase, partial [Algiphilus sp.]
EIWLDLDATDDPLHGHQEGRFFHGYYRCYCYLPLYIFCGEHLLCARLRQANVDGAAGSVEELERIVAQIRARWPKTQIVIRGDSGFCRDAIMRWCEENGLYYLLGLSRNSRLNHILSRELQWAKEACKATGKAARFFRDFTYQTRKSWSRKRRVIGKAEHLPGKANPRFVVTNLPASRGGAQHLYEKLYCVRGEMENRIKEQQLGLFADRTSTATMQANQLRLYLSSFAYVLMHGLRRLGLANTELEKAQCTTIRVKLLKIGMRLRITVRKVWLSFSEGYPYANYFIEVLDNLRRRPVWIPPG